jgi:hypothetical protein
MEAHSLRRKLVKGGTLHRLVFHFEGACGLWLRECGVVMLPLSSPCSPEYPEYRLGMTGLQGDVSNAASTSDNTQAAMVPAH